MVYKELVFLCFQTYFNYNHIITFQNKILHTFVNIFFVDLVVSLANLSMFGLVHMILTYFNYFN